MTLKTSFFNKGIYKSTVKRYIWGSVAYFLILLFSTPLLIFMDYSLRYNIDKSYYAENPIILEMSYMTLPMLASIAVSLVASLLLFRFVHSKNQSVFIHSLPISRKANYISGLCAAFTLMGTPIILTGLVLFIMSLCGFDALFSPGSCLTWTVINLFGIYMMFSTAVFSANLTGNSFAAVALNVIIHSFLFICASAFYIMAEVFLHGFAQMDATLEFLAENNFVYTTFSMADSHFRKSIETWNLAVYIIAPALLYVASYFLYKKRKLETASDVAGFSCLNSVFKYITCFLATMFAFAVLASEMYANPTVIYVCLFIISICVYFACEMLLKKTLKVFYAWKGYLGFAAVFASIIILFSQTTFFGYETRIPDKDDISEVAVYSYYYAEEKPYCSGKEIIDLAVDTHKRFVSDTSIPKIKGHHRSYGTAITRIHIDYKLKSGKSVLRVYDIASNEFESLMDTIYSNEEYKRVYELIFIDDDRIVNARINDNIVNVRNGLLKALRDDYLSLSYSDIYYTQTEQNGKHENSLDIWFDCNLSKNLKNGEPWINSFHITVNKNFKNTLKWLEENGYYKLI